MKNGPDITDGDIDRSQGFLGAILGADEDGNLPPPDRLHNQPPEPVSDEPVAAPEDAEVAKLVGNATEWSKQYPTIDTEEVAKAATDWIQQLNDLKDAYEEKFKAAKKPHETELKTARDTWKPRLERIEICLRAINPPHRDYIKKEDARVKAERAAKERAAAEAQRQADQLAEQAKAGSPETMIAAAEAMKEAEQARKVAAAIPQRAKVRGNLGGRTHSLRSGWKAELIGPEQDLAYAHFRNHPEVVALLARLGSAAVRAQSGPRPDGGLMFGQCAALPGYYVYHSEE